MNSKYTSKMKMKVQGTIHDWGYQLRESSGGVRVIHQFGDDDAKNEGAFNEGVWIVVPTSADKAKAHEKEYVSNLESSKDDGAKRKLKVFKTKAASPKNTFTEDDFKEDDFIRNRYCATKNKADEWYASLVFAKDAILTKKSAEEAAGTSFRQAVDLTRRLPYVMKSGRGALTTAPTECLATQVVRGERGFPNRVAKHGKGERLAGSNPSGHAKRPVAMQPNTDTCMLDSIFGPNMPYKLKKEYVENLCELELAGKDQVRFEGAWRVLVRCRLEGGECIFESGTYVVRWEGSH